MALSREEWKLMGMRVGALPLGSSYGCTLSQESQVAQSVREIFNCAEFAATSCDKRRRVASKVAKICLYASIKTTHSIN